MDQFRVGGDRRLCPRQPRRGGRGRRLGGRTRVAQHGVVLDPLHDADGHQPGLHGQARHARPGRGGRPDRRRQPDRRPAEVGRAVGSVSRSDRHRPSQRSHRKPRDDVAPRSAIGIRARRRRVAAHARGGRRRLREVRSDGFDARRPLARRHASRAGPPANPRRPDAARSDAGATRDRAGQLTRGTLQPVRLEPARERIDRAGLCRDAGHRRGGRRQGPTTGHRGGRRTRQRRPHAPGQFPRSQDAPGPAIADCPDGGRVHAVARPRAGLLARGDPGDGDRAIHRPRLAGAHTPGLRSAVHVASARAGTVRRGEHRGPRATSPVWESTRSSWPTGWSPR